MMKFPLYFFLSSDMDLEAVFQIEPVLPPETDKRTAGRIYLGSSPPCRTGLFSATSEFLNFSNRTIIKGDMAIFVKPIVRITFFLLFHTIELHYSFV